MLKYEIIKYVYIVLNIWPLIGSFIIWNINTDKNIIKNIALILTICFYIASMFLWVFFDKLTSKFQFVFSIDWLKGRDLLFGNSSVSYEIGIDGISIFFILLTTFIFPLCILSCWKLLDELTDFQLKFYLVNFIMLEFFLLNAFLTTNLLMFYIFFESVLIPMMFIIGIWGPASRRIKANYYFVFYTIAGSALLLFSIIVIWVDFGSLSYIDMFIFNTTEYCLHEQLQKVLFFFFFLSFAVKVPMFPFHIWLPEAHVEAPTTGSVILAALLLKLGGYGFIRFIPLFPEAYNFYSPLVVVLAVLSILYASMCAIRQTDIKKIIAYSSVAHMNLCVLGIFSLNYEGIIGGLYLLLSHGLVSAALFLLVGMLYDRYGTKALKYYGGLVLKMPLFSIFFLFFSVSNMAFPTTSNFIGEFIVLLGVAERNISIVILAASGMLFTAIYSIWLFNRLVLGNPREEHIGKHQDLTKRETYIIIILVLSTLLFGVCPDIILETSSFTVKQLLLFC